MNSTFSLLVRSALGRHELALLLTMDPRESINAIQACEDQTDSQVKLWR